MRQFDYELGQNFDRDTPANERAESDKYWDSDSQFLSDQDEPSTTIRIVRLDEDAGDRCGRCRANGIEAVAIMAVNGRALCEECAGVLLTDALEVYQDGGDPSYLFQG